VGGGTPGTPLERAGITRATDAVPTASIRAGDFSGLPVTIYDPATGNPDGGERQPFAGNRIPANRINAISNRIQNLTPLPNQAGTSQGTLNNYFSSGTEKLNRYNYDFKVNWNPTSSLAVWAKYSRMDAVVGSQFVFGEELGGPGLSRAGAPEVSDVRVNIPTFGAYRKFSIIISSLTTWSVCTNTNQRPSGDIVKLAVPPDVPGGSFIAWLVFPEFRSSLTTT